MTGAAGTARGAGLAALDTPAGAAGSALSNPEVFTVAFIGDPFTSGSSNTAPHSSHDFASADTIAPQFAHA